MGEPTRTNYNSTSLDNDGSKQQRYSTDRSIFTANSVFLTFQFSSECIVEHDLNLFPLVEVHVQRDGGCRILKRCLGHGLNDVWVALVKSLLKQAQLPFSVDAKKQTQNPVNRDGLVLTGMRTISCRDF